MKTITYTRSRVRRDVKLTLLFLPFPLPQLSLMLEVMDSFALQELMS